MYLLSSSKRSKRNQAVRRSRFHNALNFELLENRWLMADLDDSISEAFMLRSLSIIPASVSASISPDTDVNMVGFDVSAGQVIDFDIDTPTNGPGGLGTYIRLFNAQGVQLAFNNDGTAPGENSLGFDSYLRYTFPTSGTFYLGTSNYNNFQYNALTGNGDTAGGLYSIGNYVLIVKALPVDLDDSISEATSLGPVTAVAITIDSSLVTDIDVNMVSFSVNAGQVVDFDIDTPLNGLGGLGSYIRLFNSSGTQLAFNNDGAAPGENTLGFDSYLRYVFPTAGTYYLGVSNFNNVQYDPISGNGDTAGGQYSVGTYKLFVQTAADTVPDLNDSIAEASPLGAITTTPISVSSSLAIDVDVNVVSFNVTAGQVVDFDIDTVLNGSGGLGSFVRLFDAQGNQLAFNNDGLAPGENRFGFDAYLRYTFVTAGTYYLGVSNFNNVQYNAVTGDGDTAGGVNTVGSYQLIVTGLPVDADDSIFESTLIGAISATPVTVNNSLVTDIDVNMVAFLVASGQVVDFDIDTALNGAGGLGSYIRLFNAQGQQLAFNNDAAAPGESVIGFDAYLRYTFVTGGTFYLGVSNFNNAQYDPTTGNGDAAGGFNSIGNYQLIVQTVAVSLPDPNDSISEAALLGPISTTPIFVSASIIPDTDVNMVGFGVTAGLVVDFDIDTTLNGAGGLGSYIRLFDAQGTQLALNNDDAAPGESRIGFDSYLRYTFATAGTYFLGVSNLNNTQYNPITGDGDISGGQNTIGAYQLIIQALPIDTNDSISESLSLGSVTATPVIVNASITTDIDVNMVGFFVTAGQVVDFDIDTPLNGSGGLGSFVRLFNTQGQQLAFNNDAAAPGENVVGFDAYLRYTFTTGGTYYLGVSNLNNVQYEAITGNSDTAGGFNSIGTYQLIVQSAAAVVPDPNDAISEAASLGAVSTTPISVSGSISPDTDVNMVGFTVGAGQVVDFDIDTTLNGAGGLGSYIRLFDAQGNQLAFNNDGAAPGENSIGFDAYLRYTFVTAGTFYLGVSNLNNILYDAVTGNGDTAGGANATGTYQLIVQALPVDTNDSISEANSLGAISATPVTVSASIVNDIDVNMVAFTVNNGQIVDFDIDSPLNGPGGLGSFIRLFNTQGQQLAFNNDAAAPGENSVGFDAYLRYTFTTSGTYYLGVSNHNNLQYDALTGNDDTTGGFNSIGTYQLIVQTAASIVPDPNDAISEAASLGAISTTPLTVSASISPDTDVNMVGFTVTAGQVVDFDIDTTLNGANGLGSYVRLFDAQGQQLAFNNDAAAPGENVVGFDAYLRYTFTTAGTYYLGVSNLNNVQYDALTGNGDTAGGFNSIGNYQLIVQTAAVVVPDPNDAISEAAGLGAISTTPITVNASISPDTDVNMVGFTVAEGQVVDFDIDTTLNGAGGLGSYIRLFDAQGNQLAFNNDGAAPGENAIGFDAYLRYTFVTAGTFYLGVSNLNNILYDPVTGNGDNAGGFDSIGTYQLIVQSAAAVVADPNDTISEAVSLGAISTTPISVSGSISPDTDVNMVGFTVTAGQVVDLDIDTTLNGAGGLGSYIRLFDAQGNQLAFNNDGAAPGENSIGFDAYLRYTFVTAGTFYLGVSNLNNILYDPVTGNGDTAGGVNAIGTYQLIVQALPVDTNDSISEANSLGAISATPLTVNVSIVTDIDVNMVAFTVSNGQVVDFDIDTPLNGPGGLGSFIRLFNAQGQQIAFNNDAAAPGENVVGFDAYLRYTFTTSGTYYLGVSNFNNVQYDALTGNSDTAGGFNSIGSYQLTVQTVASLPSNPDPNDAIVEAPQLGAVSLSPIVLLSNISPDTDVNMVGFSVQAGQIIDFDIDSALNGPGGLGSYLRLFDGQGRQLAFGGAAAAPDENVVGYDAYLRYNFASTGSYFIGVSNSNNIVYDALTGNGDTNGGANATGGYQLNILTATFDSTDHDDSISEAIALGAISPSAVSVDFVILLDTDVDMYSFVVTEGQVVDIDVDTEVNGSGGLNSYLKLFDSQGQLLDLNNNAAAPGEVGVGFDAYLRYAFLNSGTYFVAVSNDNNTQYNPLTGNGDLAGGQNATGSYRLILRALSTTLAVSFNASTIPEKNGTAVGTVSRNDADLSQPLVVNLTSSDVGSATVPASIVILANQTSVSFTVTAVDDHIVAGTKLVTITANANGFTQGSATINISDSNSNWHNSVNPVDVDGDNSVSPLDVLTIVNYLNLLGSGPVGTGNPPAYLDVDSNNFVSPLDALVVINYLNSQVNGTGEGEGAKRSLNTSVPIEDIDEYFSKFARRSFAVNKRAR